MRRLPIGRSVGSNNPRSVRKKVVTTTYGYDAFGARVFQIVATTSTSTYPFKFFSIASTTVGSTRYATSTEYVFNNDTLLSTIDQKIVNGAASGTAAVRYVHPDHLGSTDVVTDANQNLVQTLSYYPFGATRISNSTSTNEKRKFIGQFADESNLIYLNARYYNPAQGQFISQDSTFLAVGNPDKLKELSKQDQQKFLADPQQNNAYNYARNNPITNKDPNGNSSAVDEIVITAFKYASGAEGAATAYNNWYDFKSAMSSPNVSISQKVGTAIDTAIPLILMAPPLSPLGVPVTFWDVFVFTGEKITGRPASDSKAYMDALKDRLRKEKLVPGIEFYTSGSNGASSGNKAANQTTNYGAQGQRSGTVSVPGSNLPRSKDPTGSADGRPSYCWGVCAR